ncbi:hypothetical protein HMPREF0972_01565 [Actinomyces sp. oral taxon 848 str. F0332]|nr:hypothetical protein HMPREF0972_01565 [Actinomyces sp. oral taxon 848 str. F0332]
MKSGPPSPTRPASHRRHSKSKRRTGDKGTENECERAFPSHLHPARLPRIASADRSAVRLARFRIRSPREADAAPAVRRSHVYEAPQFAPLKGTHHDQRRQLAGPTSQTRAGDFLHAASLPFKQGKPRRFEVWRPRLRI